MMPGIINTNTGECASKFGRLNMTVYRYRFRYPNMMIIRVTKMEIDAGQSIFKCTYLWLSEECRERLGSGNRMTSTSTYEYNADFAAPANSETVAV